VRKEQLAQVWMALQEAKKEKDRMVENFKTVVSTWNMRIKDIEREIAMLEYEFNELRMPGGEDESL
jgi:hypothetical protein